MSDKSVREELEKLVKKWRNEATRQNDLVYADELAIAIGLKPTFLKPEEDERPVCNLHRIYFTKSSDECVICAKEKK